MRPIRALANLGGLLLTVVVCVAPRSDGKAGGPKSAPPIPIASESREAVRLALGRLRQTGSFNHPGYAWVIRARRVIGDTLYFVDFLHRREDGKGFDLVGKAVQVTVTLSDQSIPLMLEVRACQMDVLEENGIRLWMNEKELQLPLPARLGATGFRPFVEAAACFSDEQRAALRKEFALEPAQKLLLAAFGEECYDLLRADIGSSKTGQTVLATYTKAPGAEIESDGRMRFSKLAVARFDGAGKLVMRFRGTDIIADCKEVYRVLLGDDSHSLTLQGREGMKLVLPGTKAAR
jgi:hypothetical protein